MHVIHVHVHYSTCTSAHVHYVHNVCIVCDLLCSFADCYLSGMLAPCRCRSNELSKLT